MTVSTVLDVSGSMTPQKLNNAEAGIRAMMAALHEGDRHPLYTFAGDIQRIAVPEHAIVPTETIARALRETSGTHTSLAMPCLQQSCTATSSPVRRWRSC